MSTQQEQELRLQQEILAEAQKQADSILAQAENETRASLEKAEKDNARMRDEALAEANAAAERKHRNIIRGVWMEKRRMWLSERENCLEECFDSILAKAQAMPAEDKRRADSLTALAREAASSIQAKAITAVVAPADAALVTPEWLEKQCGQGIVFTVRTDNAMKGGIKMESADGARAYDNSYAGRLSRMKEQFRREIAMNSDISTEEV